LRGVTVFFGAAPAFVVLTGFAPGAGFAVFVLVSIVMVYIPFVAFSKKFGLFAKALFFKTIDPARFIRKFVRADREPAE
jgi:hypothetical protein